MNDHEFCNTERIVVSALLSGDEELAFSAARRMSDLRLFRLPTRYVDSLPDNTEEETLSVILSTLIEGTTTVIARKRAR